MRELTLETLLEIERRGWDALCDSTGSGFYRDLMTPEAVMVLVNGAVLDRAAVIESLDHAPPWDHYSLTDARLVPVSPASAILVYRASATRDGDAEPFVALMASHYCRTADGIRLALYQQTAATR